MTTILAILGLLLCAAMVVAFVVRSTLRQRSREQRRAAARVCREEQDRIWHERIRERATAEVD